MRTYVKLTITGILATAALAALVGSASANRLSITNRNIRVVWSSLEFIGASTTIRCRATFEGTLHSNSITKVEASLIGYVTAARIAHPCTGGSAWAYNGTEANEALPVSTLPTSLPWHLLYGRFSGTLPAITSVEMTLNQARFLVRASFFGINLLCMYRSAPARGLIRLRANLGAGGVISSFEITEAIESETAGCPQGFIGDPGNDGIVTLLGTVNRISITLI